LIIAGITLIRGVEFAVARSSVTAGCFTLRASDAFRCEVADALRIRLVDRARILVVASEWRFATARSTFIRRAAAASAQLTRTASFGGITAESASGFAATTAARGATAHGDPPAAFRCFAAACYFAAGADVRAPARPTAHPDAAAASTADGYRGTAAGTTASLRVPL
jgi:hypothetical protein